jgi:hypothetical protein
VVDVEIGEQRLGPRPDVVGSTRCDTVSNRPAPRELKTAYDLPSGDLLAKLSHLASTFLCALVEWGAPSERRPLEEVRTMLMGADVQVTIGGQPGTIGILSSSG